MSQQALVPYMRQKEEICCIMKCMWVLINSFAYGGKNTKLASTIAWVIQIYGMDQERHSR